ncbi:transposase [Chryseobacterium sp. R2ACT005]|uniref:transposase n=1 Tax=Chryseobacterium sp. R2ACT005 TaxID=3416668 RepID=UPI003CFB8839
MEFKDIHIGRLIEKRVLECELDLERICSFFMCSTEEVYRMYHLKSMDSEIILRWSKLTEYDFFRIYTQHLILYSPATESNVKASSTTLPRFKKNIYTKEIIDFFLELINSGEKSKNEIIEEYNIPKTTLYKWVVKYGVNQ